MSAAGGPNIITAASRGNRNSLVFYLDHRKSFRLGKDLKNNLDLTLQNGIARNTYDSVRAIGFDGSNDRIDFPAITLSTAWTISYWFYHDHASSNDMILGEYNTGPNRFYHRDTGSSYRIRVHNDDYENIQDFVIGDRRQMWTHIAYAKNSSRVYGWLNGELTMDTANTDAVPFVLNTIGLPYTSTSYNWLGGIDFVAVYNKVLNDKQVKRLYNRHRKYFGL